MVDLTQLVDSKETVTMLPNSNSNIPQFVETRSEGLKRFLTDIYQKCENEEPTVVSSQLLDSMNKLEIDEPEQCPCRLRKFRRRICRNPFQPLTSPDCYIGCYRPRAIRSQHRHDGHGDESTMRFPASKGINTQNNLLLRKSRRKAKAKKRPSLIREALLKLYDNDPKCPKSNQASTLLKEACKLSVFHNKSKVFGDDTVIEDFKSLKISHSDSEAKDNASGPETDFQATSFQSARSDTSPEIKDDNSLQSNSQQQQPNQQTSGTKNNTCSLQARMSANSCDVTIDELASYFEEYVHIPKKMSSMAEMMYI